MRKTKLRVRTAFAPELRFELRPTPAVPFRATLETDLERLKDTLLARELTLAPTPDFVPPLRRAANEAAALAWNTVCPLLVFPELFAEKRAAALLRLERQAHIYKNSRELLPV